MPHATWQDVRMDEGMQHGEDSQQVYAPATALDCERSWFGQQEQAEAETVQEEEEKEEEPPTVLLLVPHKDAASLANLIKNKSEHEPRQRLSRVKPETPISKLMNHLKTKWKAALGVNASRLVLKDKGGFPIPMDWKWSQLCTHMSSQLRQGNVQLEYMLTDDSAAGASTLQASD